MRSNKQTSGERVVKDIKRNTRKQYSAEDVQPPCYVPLIFDSSTKVSGTGGRIPKA